MGYAQTRLALVEIKRRNFEHARVLAAASVAIQEEVARVTKEPTSRRNLAAALYALARANEGLRLTPGPPGTCDMIGRAAALFQEMPSSTYLAPISHQAEAADRTCKSGAKSGR